MKTKFKTLALVAVASGALFVSTNSYAAGTAGKCECVISGTTWSCSYTPKGVDQAKWTAKKSKLKDKCTGVTAGSKAAATCTIDNAYNSTKLDLAEMLAGAKNDAANVLKEIKCQKTQAAKNYVKPANTGSSGSSGSNGSASKNQNQ